MKTRLKFTAPLSWTPRQLSCRDRSGITECGPLLKVRMTSGRSFRKCSAIFIAAEPQSLPNITCVTSISLQLEASTFPLHTRLVAALLSNMTASLEPQAVLSPLPKADGSATYSYAGYTITASANGPIEAQKKDEHPYEAIVDVLVRPASGVGGESAHGFVSPADNYLAHPHAGTRERHLESLLSQSLRQLVLVKNFPRCLIQIVLQITAAPPNDYVNTKLVQASTVCSSTPWACSHEQDAMTPC